VKLLKLEKGFKMNEKKKARKIVRRMVREAIEEIKARQFVRQTLQEMLNEDHLSVGTSIRFRDKKGKTQVGTISKVSSDGYLVQRTHKPAVWVPDSDVVETLDEKAPKGWEGTVKAMKDEPEIDNPYALAHWMKNKGYKSRK